MCAECYRELAERAHFMSERIDAALEHLDTVMMKPGFTSLSEDDQRELRHARTVLRGPLIKTVGKAPQ